MVASDPNKSLDPLASKFVESNVAEIYLGGSRIAYVPLSRKQKLYNIKEVLRGGSILNEDGYLINNNIYTSFALIVGKEVQAINLDEALEDDSITLPVGSDLRLFTKEEYLGLVASDPSKSLDPLASKFVESNVTEIYLGGSRIAYVPLSRKQKLYNIKEVLRGGSILNEDGYLINNNIYTSFALIVGKEVQAINLDEALEDDSITLPVGSDLRLFTKEEYLGLVASDPSKSLDPLASKFVESNVTEIYLGGSRIAYVPLSRKQKLYNIKEVLKRWIDTK